MHRDVTCFWPKNQRKMIRHQIVSWGIRKAKNAFYLSWFQMVCACDLSVFQGAEALIYKEELFLFGGDTVKFLTPSKRRIVKSTLLRKLLFWD